MAARHGCEIAQISASERWDAATANEVTICVQGVFPLPMGIEREKCFFPLPMGIESKGHM